MADERKYLTSKDVELLSASYEYIRSELIKQEKDNKDKWERHDAVSAERHESVRKELNNIKDLILNRPCEVHAERTINNKKAIEQLSTCFWGFVVVLVGGSIVTLTIKSVFKM